MPIGRYATTHLEWILHDKTDLLEVWEVADLTNSHERTVRRWIASGKLAALQKTARGFLIPKQALIDFLTGEKPPGSEAA
ncbi:MAG: excisionase family DNA-binding protein [Planctomycetes bacterium]|nr:excisionase family DNA-binding protein [Planctomycetota bacterium]